MMKFARTMLMVGALAAGMAAAATLPARALVEIDVNKGNVQPLPIAVTDFLSGDTMGADISGVIAADLKRSGLFAPIDKSAFIEKISNPDVAPRFDDWKVINAQALVTGRVTKEADGRLRAEFRLWDTFAGQQLVGEQYFANPANWRRIGHIIADAIYETPDRRKGLFRHAHRLHRRIRPQERPRQAAGDHGPGRRQPALSVRRPRAGADAALLADAAGNHLHVLRERPAARSTCCRSRPGSANSSAISPA